MGCPTEVRFLPGWRQRLACLVLGLAAALPPAGADGAPVLQGPARCRFAVPADWPVRDVRWSGACNRARLAEGRGVLRAYEGARVVKTFYGRLKAGQPELGAVEVEGGWLAGRFQGGRPLNDGDRNTLIQAFDEASTAARTLAAGYRKAGNAASARLYQDKAAQLARQLD
jgi:hypothetical protein